MEIERKWLLCCNPETRYKSDSQIRNILNSLSAFDRHDDRHIMQWYLSNDNDEIVRFRSEWCDDEDQPTNTINKKTGTGMCRVEEEIKLPESVGDIIRKYLNSAASEYPHVFKYRHTICVPSHYIKLEIDEFGGRLSGLILMEIEFRNMQAATDFKLSDLHYKFDGCSEPIRTAIDQLIEIAVEVTNNKEYNNSNLAKSILARKTTGTYALIEKLNID